MKFCELLDAAHIILHVTDNVCRARFSRLYFFWSMGVPSEGKEYKSKEYKTNVGIFFAELFWISRISEWVWVEICSFRGSKLAVILSPISSSEIRLLFALISSVVCFGCVSDVFCLYGQLRMWTLTISFTTSEICIVEVETHAISQLMEV